MHNTCDIVIWESPNGRWTIWKYLSRNQRVCIKITDDKTGLCDYPILWDDSNVVGFDYPERIPTYVRLKAGQIMRKMRKNGTLGEIIA